MGRCSPQERQQLSCMLPCTSTTHSADVPAAGWSPSTFCVTSFCSFLLSSRCSSARWPAFGCGTRPSERMETIMRQNHFSQIGPESQHVANPPNAFRAPSGLTKTEMSDASSAPGFFVQSPSGPRKSGIPESVLTPAPVSTTIRDDSSTSLCRPLPPSALGLNSSWLPPG